MPGNTQKKHSATARYNEALARLKEEERRFETRQKIILGGALIALRRKNGDAGAKLLRLLIPYISEEDRSTVSDLLDVQERFLPDPSSRAEKEERMRDAANVAAARKAAREASAGKSEGDEDGWEDALGRAWSNDDEER